MIIADQFECVIPSANAVKQGVLYCTTNPPVPAADSAMWAAWATALGTFMLVVGAFWAGHIALKTLKQQRDDSFAAQRPFLTAQVVPSLAGPPNYDLVVENIGGSPAIEIEIDSPDFPKNADNVSSKVKELFNVVNFMAQGAKTRNYWRLEVAKGSSWSDGTKTPAGMPKRAELIISYKNLEGMTFRDRFIVDTRMYTYAPAPAVGPNVKESLSPGEKDLHSMLGVIASSIGELRR